MLKDLLEKGCFKLVCGAGNEDVEEVEKLVAVYSAAGCKFFDLSANPEIIKAAKRGLEYSKKNAALCVSVGIKGDPHISKARIDYEKCTQCGMCNNICPPLEGGPKSLFMKSEPNGKNTFSHLQRVMNENGEAIISRGGKCIGCGKCLKVCDFGAISFFSENKNLDEVLPPVIAEGIDCIELHAMGLNEDEISEKWQSINRHFDGILSICTSRGKLSDEKMIERIRKMIDGRKPYSTIIQADGFPMSGGEDDYKTTLQAVATAEIVQNENLPVYIMLSGGTNSKTAELARLCEINYNGIAVGSYARKIVKDAPDFHSAVKIAETLVRSVCFE